MCGRGVAQGVTVVELLGGSAGGQGFPNALATQQPDNLATPQAEDRLGTGYLFSIIY
jgi:hypothetical protein